jgi:isoleucyl-tRNA synthetase
MEGLVIPEGDWSEDRVLEFWRTINAFQKSLQLTEGCPEYTMYDGPPFATGLPHYGHLVASTIKDIIPRWKTMTGHHVTRQWAWDCHGLPIEFKIEQKLGIKTKQQVLDLGIGNYNDECRKIVMECAEQWKTVIERLGRWVDMENDCKTMDFNFMESVWWVFSELFKKGLVYRGYKVIYYSMGCKSPISNFEAKSNYQSTSDWAINVKFRLETGETALVFTTTPWTLPSNVGIAVNPEFEYCKIRLEDDDTVYIVGKPHLKQTFKKRKFKVIDTIKGSDLVGVKYAPLFEYFKDYSPGKAFKIYSGDFVVESKGTGLVHCAPAHGDEDYKLCLANDIFAKTDVPPCPLDDECNFTDEVRDFVGRNVKESENDIVKLLGERGQLLSKGKEVHDYPFCWRSNTPLIQKVCECWFIDVPKITDQLIKNNQSIGWVPAAIGQNRFGEWLKNSQEWCVSRNRFWGTPMPLWSNEDGSEVVCVSSVAELGKKFFLSVERRKN